MREPILRQAYAAHKHGFCTSSTVGIARWNRVSISHLQSMRHKSTQSAQASSSSTASIPNDQQSQPSSRFGKLASSATPSTRTLPVSPPDQPALSTDRQFAVDGFVKDLASTRPPPLKTPDPPHPHAWPRKGNWKPGNWDFKYLYHLGRGYVSFYWAGIKQLYGNVKIMFKINYELNGTTPDAAARYAAVPEKISYNDYELMLRTRRDMKKMVPFLIILGICGEFTPLVILFFGSMVVPGTCVIPKQVLQDREKMLERDDTYNREVARLMRECGGTLDPVRADRKKFIELQNLIAYQAGLTRFKKLPPVVGGLYWHFRTSRNLARHCDEILSEATLIAREGGWSKKSPQDMWEWGNKYGLYRLRQYTRQAMAHNKDPVSEEMKTAMLPHFKAEVENMFGEDFRYIPRLNHCTIALNSPLYHRPDIDYRNKEIKRLAGKAPNTQKAD